MKHLITAALLLGAVFSVRGVAEARTIATAGTAQVRMIHMSPGTPAADIFLDGQRVFAGVGFKQSSTYSEVPAGRWNLTVSPAGQSAPVVVDAVLDVQAGKQLTVVATGQLPKLQPFVLTDDNTPPPPGQAKVRFVHVAPDVPAVDVAVKGGPILFHDVDYRGYGAYLPVPAGTYTLEVRPAGQTTVALTVPDVKLGAGEVVTFFGAGKLADGTVSAVPVIYAPAVDGSAVTGSAAEVAPAASAAVNLPSAGVGPLSADAPLGGALWLLLMIAWLMLGGGFNPLRRLNRRAVPEMAGAHASRLATGAAAGEGSLPARTTDGLTEPRRGSSVWVSTVAFVVAVGAGVGLREVLERRSRQRGR